MEYHGWIVLASSQDDWDDGDFERAFRQTGQLLNDLSAKEGHRAQITDGAIFPRMVHLGGYDVRSIDLPIRIIKSIAKVFDKAYGELASSDGTADAWNASHVKRQLLTNGELEEA